MKNNTLLIIGAAALVYFLCKRKQVTKMPANVLETTLLPANIEEVKSQTVNFKQLAPTPATVMDLPGTPAPYNTGACNCNNNKLSGMPFVC